MAIRIGITKPQLFHHFRSAVNPAAGNYRLTVFKASSSFSSSPATRKLILYSKPGCCLCDGLKEKLDAAFSLSSPNSIGDIELQVRDITTDPEWERLYQYEIPVLARVREDGVEETLPRLSPRLGVELVQKKIAAAFDR
ncbi:uncharacterized protein LOC131024147 [Salvia miltiorrhiza]|uniref:uncharacterized protein LOC131024147 n=1 Tax=Salvia miltiorrhiza TaxID=226208 RepID=UPI0025ACDE07|nr:uncharacterized protein LOC131024147 [Salvia miltiorrhiza]